MHLALRRISPSHILRSSARMSSFTPTSTFTFGPLVFRQLYEAESSTYTYLLGDPESKEAIIIDPVLETVNRDLQLVKDLGLTLKYAINTHCHADHITSTGKMKESLPGLVTAISRASEARSDWPLEHGDVLRFGSRYITARATPGHTNGCMSYVLDNNMVVFTGDTLFIRGCGRTDFQQGSSEGLYDSVHSQLYTLPDDCTVFPGHDYKGQLSSTIGEEKAHNPRLKLANTKEQFVDIMSNLKLALPKKIDVAVPANLVCGIGI